VSALRSSLSALLVCAIALTAAALPMSVFVVHCEPTKANPVMWIELVDLVAQADAYNVPLSIDFTPQWASMILDDPSKIALVEDWIVAGHEIGCHHHGYWGTKARGSTWDGYTNTLQGELDPSDRSRYLGTMDGYMALLNALPGERRSGCMGGSEPGDYIDYPCQLEYSTAGHSLDDVVTTPVALVRNDCPIVEIGHGLIVSQERDALRNLYTATANDAVFGVNGHVYNFAEFPAPFIEWFSYLYSLDAAGEFRGTVSEVIDRWQAND